MADISIIVPIYNAEKYIEKCVDSLLNQTKKELEFILINDGSTDGTHDILKSYKDKRIKYFKNKNQGIGKTRNFGIEKATGKYIIFIDSDDYIEPTACEELYNKAKEEKADVVVCDFYKVYDDGSKEDINLPSFKTSKLKDNPNNEFIYKTKLRYKDSIDNLDKEIISILSSISEVNDELLFASAVVEFGLILRDSEYKGNSSYEHLLNLLSTLTIYDDPYKDDFKNLVNKAYNNSLLNE